MTLSQEQSREVEGTVRVWIANRLRVDPTDERVKRIALAVAQDASNEESVPLFLENISGVISRHEGSLKKLEVNIANRVYKQLGQKVTNFATMLRMVGKPELAEFMEDPANKNKSGVREALAELQELRRKHPEEQALSLLVGFLELGLATANGEHVAATRRLVEALGS